MISQNFTIVVTEGSHPKGHAYQTDNGWVYFDLPTQEGSGNYFTVLFQSPVVASVWLSETSTALYAAMDKAAADASE